MPDYSKSIIYKLCCKDINIKEIYIGSTTNFKRRKCEHKSTCNNSNNKNYNLNVYQYIRANGNWDNWDMIIIEKFECNDKLELHKRERYWLENLQASLNSKIPNRSKKEWEEDNKDKLKEYCKEWKDNNKEKYNEKNKEYYENNKEYFKVYRENNKDKIKEYYENNKEEYNKKRREKVECNICNKVMNRGNLNTHKKKFHN